VLDSLRLDDVIAPAPRRPPSAETGGGNRGAVSRRPERGNRHAPARGESNYRESITMETGIHAPARSAVAEKYRDAAATLDGKPARIVGWKLPYAIVRCDDGRDVGFSWPTVAAVMAAGGAFRS
jgi:hypothetical protein